MKMKLPLRLVLTVSHKRIFDGLHAWMILSVYAVQRQVTVFFPEAFEVILYSDKSKFKLSTGRNPKELLEHGAGQFWQIADDGVITLVDVNQVCKSFRVPRKKQAMIELDLVEVAQHGTGLVLYRMFRLDKEGKLHSRKKIKTITGVRGSLQRKYEAMIEGEAS